MKLKVTLLIIVFYLSTTIFCLWINDIKLFDFFDNRFSLLFYNQLREPTIPSDDIKIIKVDLKIPSDKLETKDGKILSRYGFWYRKFHKDIIYKLVDNGVKDIAFDFYFPKTKSNDPDFEVKNQVTNDFIDGLKYAKSKSVNVFISIPPESEPVEIQKEILNEVTDLVHPYINTKDNIANSITLKKRSTWALSLRLASSYLDKTPDTIAENIGTEIVPNMTYYSKSEQKLNFLKNKKMLFIEDDKVAFKSYSYSDIYFSNVDFSDFNGKLVLIGSYELDIHNKYIDSVVSPLDFPQEYNSNFNIPGVLFHAHAINTILQQKEINIVSRESILFLSMLVIFLIFILVKLFKSTLIFIYYNITLLICLILLLIISANMNYIIKPSLPIVVFSFSFILTLFIKIIEQSEQIKLEKNKSEKLLLNILPEGVAIELKHYGRTLSRNYNLVTVLFTDFKGFTMLAEKLTPDELVDELSRCFEYFDIVASQNNMERIKTIGDSYMCAGGLPIPNITNPFDAILMGLKIIKFMEDLKQQRINKGLPYWELRLGINSGPVVAGVVGKSKFAYDIWGDTVNTASRMESSGIPNKINISSITYEYIKELFVCEYRGKIEAKNKGMLEMYLVNGIKPIYSIDNDMLTPNKTFYEIRDKLSEKSL